MAFIDIFNICLIEKSQFVCPNDIDLLIDFFQLNYEFLSGQVIDCKIEFLIEFPWLAACSFLAFSFWCLHNCSKVAQFKQSLLKGWVAKVVPEIL